MARVSPTLITQKLLNNLIWKIPDTKNKLFLTFDDGPTPEITFWILKTLKEYNAKATFFCLGKNVEKHPDIYNSIIEDNHSVGNHTYSHVNGWKHKTKDYILDVEMASNNIKTNLFRPPYGKIKISQISKINHTHKVIMWNVLSKDYSVKTSNEECFINVVKYSKEGSIIVFHDSEKAKSNLMYSLPKVLNHFSNLGYEFCPIYI